MSEKKRPIAEFDDVWKIGTFTQKSVDGLMPILLAVSGRKVVAEYGEEPDSLTDPSSSGTYIVEFEGGVALKVRFSEGLRGYSEMTPPSPASVDYYILRRIAE